VARLADGNVTTAESEADAVVTEFGVADLRVKTLAERAHALIAVAHPEHREALERDAGALRSTGST
jgi:acyl-CoA hydrolase